MKAGFGRNLVFVFSGYLAIAVAAGPRGHAHETGGGSTGGGFSMEAGPYLKQVATELARKIRKAPAASFSKMPPEWQANHWTPERLARIVEGVCQEEDATRSRNDAAGVRRRLIFDYCDGTVLDSVSCERRDCMDQNQQYITALARFFDMNETSRMPQVELETRLLHEASHLFGLKTDALARPFAEHLLNEVTTPGVPFEEYTITLEPESFLDECVIRIAGHRERRATRCSKPISFTGQAGKQATRVQIWTLGLPGTSYRITAHFGGWHAGQDFSTRFKLSSTVQKLEFELPAIK